MKLFITFSLMLLCSQIFAQSQSKWSVLFGTEEFTGLQKKNLPEDLPNRIALCPNGDIVITGTNNLETGDPKPGSMGAWLTLLTDDGKFKWYQVGAQNMHTFMPYIINTTTGNAIIGCGSPSGGSEGFGDDGISLYIYDNNGTLTLKKDFQTKNLCSDKKCGEQGGQPIEIWENKSGDIEMVASITIREETFQDGMIVRALKRAFIHLLFSATGELKNVHFLERPDYYTLHNVIIYDNGYYFIQYNENTILVSCFSNGSLQWEKNYNTTQKIEYIKSFRGLDNSVIVSYNTSLENLVPTLAVQASVNGEITPLDILGNRGMLVQLFPVNNGYIMGYMTKLGEGSYKILKIDKAGKELWSKVTGTTKTLLIDGIILPDESTIWLSYTKEFGANYIDALIVKYDKDGNWVNIPQKYVKAK